MAEVKDKVVTVESLMALHEHNMTAYAPMGSYAPYTIISEEVGISEVGQTETELQRIYAAMPDNSIKFVILNHVIVDSLAGGVWHVEIHKTNDNYGKIIANTYSSGMSCQRPIYEGEWMPWEYTNPYMAVGEEYRTTERWRDKAVYTQLVDLGTFSTSGFHTCAVPTGVVNMIRYNGVIYDESENAVEAMPVNYGEWVAYIGACNTTHIQVYVGESMLNRRVLITLWYTKN